MAVELADLYVKLRTQAGEFASGMRKSGEEGESFSKRFSNSMATVGKGVALAGVGVTVASVKMAGDFQQHMNLLVTACGEAPKAMKGISDGVLSLARQTGTSTSELADGMYQIEKASYRGADGLKVLKAAAQGAREEGANLKDVTNAMTSVMASYHLKASDSVSVMNQLKTAAGEGKMTMEEFSAALSTVIPIASANKVSFAEVGGAIATLTQHGTSARDATHELGATIRALAAPNRVAQTEMQQLGLSVTDVSTHIGSRGLTGTVDLLVGAITKHMGPAGTVLLNAFNQSKSAAADATIMISKMPPSLQTLAKQFQSGKISVTDWKSALKGLPVDQANLANQFSVVENKAKGFNSILRSGDPAAQTFTDALKKMSGGAIGLNTILQLSGENTDGFKERVRKVGESAKHAGKDVEGWEVTQKNFNTQMSQLKQVVQTAAITYGLKLLPVLTATFTWFEKHKTITQVLAGIITGFLVAAVAVYAAKQAATVVKGVVGFGKLGVAGVQAGGRIVQGFRSAEVAGSAFSGKAGSFGGALRKGVDAAGSGWSKLASGAKTAASAVASTGTKLAAAGKAAALAALDVGKLGLSYVKAGALAAASAVKYVAVAAAQAAVKVATAAWAAVQWILDAALDANPIGLIVIAIAALVAGVIYAYTHFSTFRKIVDAVFSWLKGAVVFVINFVKQHWELVVSILLGPIGIVAVLLIKYWKQISGAVSGAISWVIDFVKNHWRLIVSIIGGPLGLIFALVTKYWTQIKDFISKAINKVKSDISSALNVIKTAWNIAWNAVKTIISTAWGAINDIIHGRIGDAIAKVKALPGKLLGALGNVGSLLVNAGKSIVQGLINGITGMFGSIGSTMSGLVNTVKSYLPFSPAKKGPLSGKGNPKYSGHSIVEQLAGGIAEATMTLHPTMHKVASVVHKGLAGSLSPDAMHTSFSGHSYGTFHTSSGSASGGGGGSAGGSSGGSGGGTTVTCKCNCSDRPIKVYLDGKQIYSSMQHHALKHHRRNGSNGLSLQQGRL